MAEITFNDVTKRYPDGFEAVKHMNLEIGDGEFMILVGPSGCGKSTALRMIAGLESISAGTIEIGGRVVNGLEPAERDIAMVFQNYALYPHMTVRQNLAYGLRNRRTPAAEIERRIGKAAEVLEIAPYLDRKPRQLSGGQRQRVAMGRAIVREPEAFLFDEPLSNLDAKLRVQMRVEIRRLQRALGTTSVYVTHDQLEAMTLADKLVVLNAGLIEQVGSPIELYERPATLFVASFIGSPGMNLLPATASEGRVSLPGGGAVSGPIPPLAGPFTLGVRPEDLAPTDGRAEPRGFTAQAVVTAVELVGAESYVHGEIAGGKGEVVFRVPGRSALRLGETVAVAAPTGSLHFFDGGGRRLAS